MAYELEFENKDKKRKNCMSSPFLSCIPRQSAFQSFGSVSDKKL